MNHPCQTDRDINLQIVPEDQITGLWVLFVKMEATQKDRFHRGHPVQRQYRHTVYHTRSFLLYSKKLELSGEMRVIPTFAFYGTLTMGAAWFFEWKNGIPIVHLQAIVQVIKTVERTRILGSLGACSSPNIRHTIH